MRKAACLSSTSFYALSSRMNLQNFRLRLWLSEIEAKLSQIQDEAKATRVENSRLKQERQRRLLEEKKGIQASLDRIIYPILSIPVEIISEIFLHCLPEELTVPSASIGPMLAAICQQWRYIALGDCRLWSSLKIDVKYGDCHAPPFSLLVKEWLCRAKNMLSSLHIVLPNSGLCCSNSFFNGLAEHPCILPASWFTDSWAHLTSFRGDLFTFQECMELLRRASRLIRCEFHDIAAAYDPTPSDIIPLMLPDIQSLTLAIPEEAYDFHLLKAIFDLLILPELRSLDVRCASYCFADASSSFFPFAHRAPGIRNFTARFNDDDYYGEPLDAVMVPTFSAMPNLVNITLHMDFLGPVSILLDALTTSETFLPRIQMTAFYVKYGPDYWDDIEPRKIVDALASRSEATSGFCQLLDFRLSFSESFNFLDEEDGEDDYTSEQLFKLKELKNNGMRIHIGLPEDSWV
ncbi:hypothetical protein DFH07DRAFT_929905 [Mycena maculata]|uniref:F-box domain-containing protein n=1 Tax=Mycena maculata TaxID=230809 RepID=A0AAD7HWQ0_9AGAR|nr:hypothetical protein DFH07DRAFT_929905 [Mycena maculata]